MSDRKGLVTFGELQITLTGEEKKVGDKAPDFTVVTQGFKEVKFSSTAGKVRVISAVPSLDTGVCDAQTRRFNEEAAKIGDKVAIWTVSADLPFAQKRWCGAAGIDKIEVLSDHRYLDFGQKYGILMKELRILSRNVFVIDENDVIRYNQLVGVTGTLPDFDKAMAAVKELL